MTPFFFGARTRRLFGVYHPAKNPAGRTRAAVLCYPWGPEYLEAHRALRRLATLLADAGIHALRFDYYGTGDSAGDSADGDAAGWEADISTSIDELRDMTGAARVTLAGLRLGALLAAQVAAKRRADVDALALWDPLPAGGAYADELTETAAAHPVVAKRAFALADGGLEVLGHALTARLADGLATRTLADVAARLPRRTLLAVTTDQDGLDAARTALDTHPGIDAMLLPEAPCWLESWPISTGALPAAAIGAVAEWII